MKTVVFLDQGHLAADPGHDQGRLGLRIHSGTMKAMVIVDQIDSGTMKTIRNMKNMTMQTMVFLIQTYFDIIILAS